MNLLNAIINMTYIVSVFNIFFNSERPESRIEEEKLASFRSEASAHREVEAVLGVGSEQRQQLKCE